MLSGIETSIQHVLKTELCHHSQILATGPEHAMSSGWSLRALFRHSSSSVTCSTDLRDIGGRTLALSGMATEQLRQCLEPIVKEMESLDAEAFLSLTRVESGARLRNGLHVRPIHNDITPQNTCDSTRSVRYIHIHEVPRQYSMGIFVFPPHVKIPLHDHPQMCVISRVLYGTIDRFSLDLAPISSANTVSDNAPKKRQTGLSSWLPWNSWSCDSTNEAAQESPPIESIVGQSPSHPVNKRGNRKLAFYRTEKEDSVDSLSAPECTVLFPWEGNLHEFTAGPDGAAILDVLLPPYDAEHDRDCTFYEILDEDSIVDKGSIQDREKHPPQRASCWIVPTDQPDDFHCISGQYRNLGREAS